jgi:uroporphyrinogen-III synthase
MAKKKSAKKSVVKKPASAKTRSGSRSLAVSGKKTNDKVKTVISKKKKNVTKSASKITKKFVQKAPVKEIAVPKAKTVKPVKEEKVIISKEVKETIDKTLPVKRTRKSSKKQIITLPPPPKIDVSSYPKNKVKNILVSQPKPVDPEKNPYVNLGKKHNLNITFRHFIKVEGLTSQDFRAQRIDILEHGAVILTSKMSVDHYFKMCNEMRVTVPESMKYFCINEQTAYYLQKYIQYRKRKIFFGHGTMLDLVDVIRKNKDEKFLLPVSDVHKEQIIEFLDELHITYTKGVFYKTVSADLSDLKNLNEFDVLVFFTPAGIKSLKQNFPNFKQGGTRIAAFGHTAALMVKEMGYRLDIFAPNPQNPSMTGALETYIREANKR